MEKSRDYLNGLQTGKNVGFRQASDKMQAEYDRMHQRCDHAETALGVGKCDACCYWRRERSALWGTCTLSTGAICFDKQPWRGEPNQTIVTKENFGCIFFVSPATTAGDCGA